MYWAIELDTNIFLKGSDTIIKILTNFKFKFSTFQLTLQCICVLIYIYVLIMKLLTNTSSIL